MPARDAVGPARVVAALVDVHGEAAAGAERGRSINLAISARGLDALGRVGLDERTLDDALPMRGRTLHSPSGALAYQSYSADGTRAINSISRAGLNHALLDRAEETPGVPSAE